MNAALSFIIKLTVILFIFVGIPAIYYLTLPQYKVVEVTDNASELKAGWGGSPLSVFGMYKIPGEGKIPATSYRIPGDGIKNAGFYRGYYDIDNNKFGIQGGPGNSAAEGDPPVYELETRFSDKTAIETAAHRWFIVLSKNGKWDTTKTKPTKFSPTDMSHIFSYCMNTGDNGRTLGYSSIRKPKGGDVTYCYSGNMDANNLTRGTTNFKYL